MSRKAPRPPPTSRLPSDTAWKTRHLQRSRSRRAAGGGYRYLSAQTLTNFPPLQRAFVIAAAQRAAADKLAPKPT